MTEPARPMTVRQMIDLLSKQDDNAIVKIGVSFWLNNIPSEAEGYVGCSIVKLARTSGGEVLLKGEDELNKGEY